MLSWQVQGSLCGWSGGNQKHCRRQGQRGRWEQDHEVSQEDSGSRVTERKSPRRVLSRRVWPGFHLAIRAAAQRMFCREGKAKARRARRTCCRASRGQMLEGCPPSNSFDELLHTLDISASSALLRHVPWPHTTKAVLCLPASLFLWPHWLNNIHFLNEWMEVPSQDHEKCIFSKSQRPEAYMAWTLNPACKVRSTTCQEICYNLQVSLYVMMIFDFWLLQKRIIRSMFKLYH